MRSLALKTNLLLGALALAAAVPIACGGGDDGSTSGRSAGAGASGDGGSTGTQGKGGDIFISTGSSGGTLEVTCPTYAIQVVDGVSALSAERLADVVAFLRGEAELPLAPPPDPEASPPPAAEVDFAEIRGQEAAKRALAIAASGGHNVLLIGPAGSGKTMMARALERELYQANTRG